MRRKYAPVTNLTLGINVDKDPAYLKDGESPDSRCLRFEDGILRKDLGSTQLGDILLGVPLHLDTYYQTDGDQWLVCCTTTSFFAYNTTTEVWDDYTEGTTVEDCEDAWTAGTADVTTDVSSTIKKRGTNSAKATVAAAFTTGIVEYEDFVAKDLTAYDHIHLWIYSTIAMDAADLQLLLDDTNGCVTPLETLDLPALTANTWKRVSLALAAPASLGAIVSVGINLTQNKSSFVLYVDDVRAVKEFTGTQDDRFCTAILTDLLIITNGVDAMKTFNGATIADLGGSPPLAKSVVAFADRLLVAGTEETSIAYPQRIRWSSAGTVATWSGGTSGYIDVVDTVDWCVQLMLLRDKCFLYKERSIWEVVHVGGTAVFEVKLRLDGIGTFHPFSVQNIGEIHTFLGPDGLYDFDGSSLEDTSDNVHPWLFRTGDKLIDLVYPKRVSSVYVEELGEYWFATPITGSAGVPSTLFKQSKDKAWSRRDSQNITCFGLHEYTEGITTWSAATGTWAEQVGSWRRRGLPGSAPTTLMGKTDSYIYEDDRATVTSEEAYYQTKDHIFSHSTRVFEFRCYARYGPFYLSYSLDGGVTWSESTLISYLSDWKEVSFYINKVTQRIRFRILSTATSLDVKWYEVRYIPRDRSASLTTS